MAKGDLRFFMSGGGGAMPYYRFTDEQLQKANDVNIIAYAMHQGYPVKEYAKGYFKISGYGGLLLESDKWYWEAEQRGGGPIQFVMMMKKLSWVEAVKELLNESSNESMTGSMFYPTSSKRKKVDKSKFRLPEKGTTYKHIFAYLINARNLDQELVQKLVADKKLYEDVNQNCVFVGYDPEGVPRHAFLRGTKPDKPFRGDVAGSNKQYSFCMNGTTNRVFVFEAAIDAISYQTLRKKMGKHLNDHYLSLSGLSLEALDKLISIRPDITEIVVCTDNDQKGNMVCQKIQNTYKMLYQVKRDSPAPHKDFNALLCYEAFNEYLRSQGLEEAPTVQRANTP